MKTQGISKNLSLVQAKTAGKAAKAGDSSFDSIMARNTTKVDTRNNDRFSAKQTDQKVGNAAKDINSSRDDFNQNKISLKNDTKSQNTVENVELDEVETKVVQFLGNTFGLSEEDVLDILEQLGLSPLDLVLFMAQDTVAIQPVNVENIKAFIMEVHGVDDASLFLMSDQMSGELGDVMKGIEQILSQELGVDVSNLSQEDSLILQSFAEKLGQLVNNPGEQAKEMISDTETEVMPEIAGADVADEIPVVVEMSEESGTSDAFPGESQTAARGMEEVSAREVESPLGAFVERLTESFDNVRHTETVSPQTTMANIVEQVVNHVRIRVLPQTTSMELQLNPESLGRVNLNVTSQNGMATATLTVQNQVAKEALESQITVLRENLESQGLKVDAVEVNVSEFGFKHPEDSDQGRYPQKKQSQGQNKRFRFDSVEEVDERESAVTAEERQDGNSVVDYTA